MRLPRPSVSGPMPVRADEELRKLEAALDQLARAELYVLAAINLELADPGQRRELEDLRAALVASRRSLARPRVVERT